MCHIKLGLKFFCVKLVMFYSDHFNNVTFFCVELGQLRRYFIGLLSIVHKSDFAQFWSLSLPHWHSDKVKAEHFKQKKVPFAKVFIHSK